MSIFCMERTYNTNSRVVYLYILPRNRAETRFTEAGSNPAIPFTTSRDDEDFMDDLLRSVTYSRIGSSADSAKEDKFQQESLLKPGVPCIPLFIGSFPNDIKAVFFLNLVIVDQFNHLWNGSRVGL